MNDRIEWQEPQPPETMALLVVSPGWFDGVQGNERWATPADLARAGYVPAPATQEPVGYITQDYLVGKYRHSSICSEAGWYDMTIPVYLHPAAPAADAKIEHLESMLERGMRERDAALSRATKAEQERTCETCQAFSQDTSECGIDHLEKPRYEPTHCADWHPATGKREE